MVCGVDGGSEIVSLIVCGVDGGGRRPCLHLLGCVCVCVCVCVR